MHFRNRWRANTAILFCAAVLVFSCSVGAYSAGTKPSKPRPGDKCPVCGMFVAKYPDFTVQIVFNDGSHVYFDGMKDMLKYYRNLSRYAPGRKQADVAALYVTDYYSLRHADGFKSYYVAGSDVYGPMGKELVPFEKKADALEFLRDHKGRSVLTFRDVSDAVMKGLE